MTTEDLLSHVEAEKPRGGGVVEGLGDEDGISQGLCVLLGARC